MKMMRGLLTLLIASVIFLPVQVYAVDFSIPEVKIDAYLQADGNAEVVEKHTYDFPGKFNGMIRGLIPKRGSEITDFKASEEGTLLEVEKIDGEYRIHRKGNREIVNVEMTYKIHNAVKKFEDGTEFYWPFFDDRNETNYGNMTVRIHPPERVETAKFLGYGAAERSGSVDKDGVVTFAMGKVPSGTNGDIRVVYDNAIFPQMTLVQGSALKEMEKDRNMQAFLYDNRDSAGLWGWLLFGLLALLVVWGMLKMRIVKQRRQREAQAQFPEGFFVPGEKLSMPATILYAKGGLFSSEMMVAALLDLIRKGHVEQLSENDFRLVDEEVEFEHERALIDLLFHKVGDGTNFNMDDLVSYTENELNHPAYNEGFAAWQKGVRDEVKEEDLIEKKPKLRMNFILASIGFVVVAILFGIFSHFISMLFAIAATVITLVVGLVYRPRTKEGHVLYKEWQHFRNAFESFGDFNEEKWRSLSTDERLRAYTFGVGAQDIHIQSELDKFEQANAQSTESASSYGFNYMYVNPVLLTTVFASATTTASASSSSYSASGGGGGVGGGGGGSGAF